MFEEDIGQTVQEPGWMSFIWSPAATAIDAFEGMAVCLPRLFYPRAQDRHLNNFFPRKRPLVFSAWLHG
jgi:hypothetical protein